MTDGKKPRPRKKVPTLQELDDMPEGGTGESEASGKGKPTSSTNRRHIRMRKGVGRNKKVVNAPPAKPKPQSASKPDKDETTAKQSDSTSSRIRVTSVKVKKSTSRSRSKPPAPESESSGGSGRTPPPPPKTPPAPEPPEPSPKQSKDEYARTMALYKAEEEWGHQMGDFDRLSNDGGRDRAYESKCVGCGRRAIAKVQYPANYSDAQGVPGWHGDATEGPCSPKPRRRTVHKTDTDKRPDTKSGKDSVSRQDSVKPSGGSTSGYQKGSSPSPSSSRRPMKSSKLKKSIRNRVRTLPAGLKITKPSLERILGNKARDEARRKAKERGHRISEFILFSYPEVEGYTVYRGRCGKCHRVALGMVKQHSDEAGKSGSIVVSGDALQHPCSGARAKR